MLIRHSHSSNSSTFQSLNIDRFAKRMWKMFTTKHTISLLILKSYKLLLICKVADIVVPKLGIMFFAKLSSYKQEIADFNGFERRHRI